MTTKSAAETQILAERIATVLQPGDLVVLLGDLGAGKTCFTQGLARGLGVQDRVTSPTYTLVNHYEGRLALNHLDVYRIAGFSEALDLDLHEMAEDGVTVIEWGHNILEALDDSRLEVQFLFDESSGERRVIVFEATDTSWGSRLDELFEGESDT